MVQIFGMNAASIVLYGNLDNRSKRLPFDTDKTAFFSVVKGIFDIITEIHRQGVTVLLIEQNANMALRIADVAYVLETGKITLSGSGRELLNNEQVKKAYLG